MTIKFFPEVEAMAEEVLNELNLLTQDVNLGGNRTQNDGEFLNQLT